MKPEQLEDFVDPATGERLRLAAGYNVVDGHVESGWLISPAQLEGQSRAARKFQIANFIPRFVPSDNYAENFGLQWQAHANTQLDSFNGSTHSRDRFFAATGWPADLQGQRVLEAGSGAGRFTEVIADTGATVFSFDYSEAVVANFANNGKKSNVCIFQGDIYNIPFPPASFDRVVCMGVLQHTPDVERSFRCLAAVVRPGGILSVDCYLRSWAAMLHWKYLLRPITTRMRPDSLYRAVRWYAPKLMPPARLARRIAGRAGHRLIPILDQSDKAVPPAVQRDWTILDTYDALAAAYDQPQSADTLRRWFEREKFVDIQIQVKPDGVGLVGTGTAPAVR